MEGVSFTPIIQKCGGGIKCSHAEGVSLDPGHLDFRHSEGGTRKVFIVSNGVKKDSGPAIFPLNLCRPPLPPALYL